MHTSPLTSAAFFTHAAPKIIRAPLIHQTRCKPILLRAVFLLLATAGGVYAQAAQDSVLLSDDFSQDTSLNPNLWAPNTPFVGTLAATMMPQMPLHLMYADIKFSSEGMTLSGVSNSRQFIGLQSTKTFVPPYSVQAMVMGVRAFANPFALYLVSGDTGQWLNLFGNLNPDNAPAYKIGVNLKDQPAQVLDASPSENKWYILTITVDGAGQATVRVADNQGIIGKAERLAFGVNPAYLVIAQNEPSPRTLGPNVAIWRSVTVVKGTAPEILALNRRPAPPDHPAVLYGKVLPPPQAASPVQIASAARPPSSPSPATTNRTDPAATPGKIIAVLTGRLVFLNDGMGVFGGGHSDFRLNPGLGPPVELVYTWNDTGEPFGTICKPYRGMSSTSPPSATDSVVLTIGNYSYTFGKLPNLHADMGRYVEGSVPHLALLELLLREGGKTINDYVIPGASSYFDLELSPAAGQRIPASCDWRESLSVPSTHFSSSNITISEGRRGYITANVDFTSLVVSGLIDNRRPDPAPVNASRAQNPVIGVWRNKSTNTFARVPDMEFTPTEEISEGQHFQVTYSVQGNTVTVIPRAGFNRRCTVTGPDDMTCTGPIIGDVQFARVR